jgi:hypothetical protein
LDRERAVRIGHQGVNGGGQHRSVTDSEDTGAEAGTAPRTLRLPEFAKTGEGARRAQLWGSGCENVTGTSEWRRRCSGRVGTNPTSNPGCEEGESGAPRPVLAPVRGEEHLGPKHGHGAGLNRSDVMWA